MKIISERKEIVGTSYRLNWNSEIHSGGFSFECDANGMVSCDPNDWNEASLKNFYECVNGTNHTKYAGVEEFDWWYVQDRIGVCDCGEEVELSHFTNTCECGIDYNMSGQLLAPRSQWGEETGEHWTDCY